MNNHCIFCKSGEPTAYVCSTCVQKISRLPQDKLQEAYALACEKGYGEKAEYLKKLLTLEEEVPLDDNRSNARKSRSTLERRRPMQEAKHSYRKDYRKKQAA